MRVIVIAKSKNENLTARQRTSIIDESIDVLKSKRIIKKSKETSRRSKRWWQIWK